MPVKHVCSIRTTRADHTAAPHCSLPSTAGLLQVFDPPGVGVGVRQVEVVPQQRQSSAQRDVVRQMIPQAETSWWVPGHAGWTVLPLETDAYVVRGRRTGSGDLVGTWRSSTRQASVLHVLFRHAGCLSKFLQRNCLLCSITTTSCRPIPQSR